MTVNTLNLYVSRFVFLQVSSFLMFFGVNLSFLFFAHLIFAFAGSQLQILSRANTILRKFVLLFAAGAFLSMFYNFWEGDLTAFSASLKVILNYVYWTIMLMLMTALAPSRALDLNRLFKMVTIALISVSIYYFIGQRFIANSLFFKKFGPNNFSFLLICYVPYLVHFTRRRVHPALALVLLGLLLMGQLAEGRRAGFILILAGGMGAYYVHIFKFDTIGKFVRLLILLLLGWSLLQTYFVKDQIRARSSRIYQLIYSSDNELANDRSALVRKAMVEKGILLFEDNIWFGVGLNNFTSIYREIDGDFEGSQFVINKNIYQRASSHNSYINILAEGGLVLFIPFMGIMLFLLLNGLRYFNRMQNSEKVIFISFVLMSAHLYFYNGIVNSLAWFNIGALAYSISAHKYPTRLLMNKIAPVILAGNSTERNFYLGRVSVPHQSRESTGIR